MQGEKLAILNSLKSESESKIWTESNYNWIIFGYTVLVSLALLMLLLFLKKYRIEIFENNNKVTFIFLNVFLMILIQTLVIKYNSIQKREGLLYLHAYETGISKKPACTLFMIGQSNNIN